MSLGSLTRVFSSRISTLQHRSLHFHYQFPHVSSQVRRFASQQSKQSSADTNVSSQPTSQSPQQSTPAQQQPLASESAQSSTPPSATAAAEELSAESVAALQSQSRSGASWRMKFHKMRRLGMIFGIPLLISFGLVNLHDSDIPYFKCFELLASDKYKIPPGVSEASMSLEEKEAFKPPMYIMYPPMIWASWFHSSRPYRVNSAWDRFMPLLDPSYSSEVRMIGLACLLSMLGGGDVNSQPPEVFYSKCRLKLEILQGRRADSGWSGEEFLNFVYKLCVDSNPQIMMAGWQLLMEMSQKPRAPSEAAISYVCTHTRNENMTREKAKLALYMYQDPRYVVEMSDNVPINPKIKAFVPDFDELQRILVRHKCLQFAFNALEHKNPAMQQMGLMVTVGLVSNYPDWDELNEALGETEDERINNANKIVMSLMNIGQDHFVRGENGPALNAFTEACRFQPSSPILRYFKANCHSELGQFEEAKLEYEQAMHSMPPDMGPMPEASLNLAQLLLKIGNSREDWSYASELLETIIDRDLGRWAQVEQVDVETVYYRLQTALEKLGDKQQAWRRMETCCDTVGANSGSAMFECGRMAIAVGEFERAEERLKRAVELEPYDMESKLYLAQAQFENWKAGKRRERELMKIGDDEEARLEKEENESLMKEMEQNLKVVLNARPGDAKALSMVLGICMSGGEWERGLNVLDQMEGKGGKGGKDAKGEAAQQRVKPFVQYQRGLIYENMNKTDEAIAAFETAVREWQQAADQLGFMRYFEMRVKERKALQKIQARCEAHMGDAEWQALCQQVFELGMTA